MKDQISPEPFGASAKIAMTVLIASIAAMWALAYYAFITLPDQIPAHFGLDGKPDRYGSKIEFLFIAPALTIGPAIILVISKYRFTLINKYPYLINIPAFYSNIYRIPEHRRGFWINRYFEAVLWLGAILGIYLLILEYGMFLSSVSGTLPNWMNFLTFSLPILILIPFIYRIFRLSREMAEEVERYQ